MKKRFLLILIILIYIFSISYGDIEIKSYLGISGEWKINRWCPLFLQIKNLGNRISLNIEVIFIQGLRFSGNAKTIYREKVEIPSLSTRTLEILLPPLDFRYPVEINVKSEDESINISQKLEHNLERLILPLILIIGDSKKIPITLPSKIRVINIKSERDLPINYKAYDCVDYVFIDYNFWKTLSSSKKNSLRLFRAFDKRAFFFEELYLYKDKINFNIAKVQFFPPTFLESPDLSIIDMQDFFFPNRFNVGLFLSIYFILLYFIRRFLINMKILIISIVFLLISGTLISIYLGNNFKNDALIIGEKGILYIPKDKNIGELFSHLILFSPFKRNISFPFPFNIIQIYQPFYQPQRDIGPLEVNNEKEVIFFSLEKSKISFIEALSLIIFPININFNVSDKYLNIDIENKSDFKISELKIVYKGKEAYLGDIKSNERKSWKININSFNKVTPSLYSYISKWKIKNDIINIKNTVLWGKIENLLFDLKIEGVKYNSRSENIIFIPLQ